MQNQKQFISSLLEKNPNAIIIGSLGTISYDLDKIEHKNKICIRGAMGCAMAVGLGYALNTDKQVIVLIGDGAFLMKAGSANTIARYAPKNLKVYVLNNGKHESTGGQETSFNYEGELDIVEIEWSFYSATKTERLKTRLLMKQNGF